MLTKEGLRHRDRNVPCTAVVIGFAFALMMLLNASSPACAQDQLVIGNGVTCTMVRPGTTAVNLPIYILDAANTSLGRDQPPGAKLQAFAFRLKVNDFGVIQTSPSGTPLISVLNSGLTYGRVAMSSSAYATYNTFAYRVQYDEAYNSLLFNQAAPFPGDLVGQLNVQLIPWTDQTRVDLLLDGSSSVTLFSDAHGVAGENSSTGALQLHNACIEIGYGDPGEPIPFGESLGQEGLLYGAQKVFVTTATLDALDRDGTARVAIDFKLPHIDRATDRRKAIGPLHRALSAELQEPDFSVIHAFENLPGTIATLNRKALDHLANLPFIKSVRLDTMIHPALLESTQLLHIAAVQAPGVYAPNGLFGDDVRIAVLDTGASPTHPDIASNLDPNGNTCYIGLGAPRPQPKCTDATDHYGHGTQMMGVLAGIGDSTRGISPGFAPHAKILNMRVMETDHVSWAGDATAALDDIVGHPEWNVKLVNMSFADDIAHVGTCDEFNPDFTQAVNDLTAAGVGIFAASGNNAYVDYVSFPACVSRVAAVGATYDTSTSPIDWSYDPPQDIHFGTVARFTNRSEKLHLVAPGAWVKTASVATTANGAVLDDVIENLWGTSISSPIATGVAALMLQRRPSLNPAELAHIMRYKGGTQVTRDERTFTNIDAQTCVEAVGPNNLRGDANGDGWISAADVMYLINAVYAGGPTTTFLGSNADADDEISVRDIFRLLSYLFAGGPPIRQ